MFLSLSDTRTGIVAILCIGLTILITQWGTRKKILTREIARKILHVFAVSCCAWAIWKFDNRVLLAWIFLLCTPLLWWVARRGWLGEGKEKSYGIAYFAPAFSLMLFVPALPADFIAYAALILAFCDSAAGLAGHYFAQKKIKFLFDEKSWAGFLAFYVTGFILSVVLIQPGGPYEWLFCFMLPVLPALTELFSYKGSDNFTIPVFTVVWLCLLLHLFVNTAETGNAFLRTNKEKVLQLLLLLPVLAILSYFAIRKRWLTVCGAAAACWMGLIIFTTCGIKGFIAPVLFLLGGSLLSKLNKPAKEKQGRNAIQVFSNGLAGTLCMIVYTVYNDEQFLLASQIAFAIGICDSVSSEAGVYLKGRTWDVLSFKKLQPGISGGISWPGTLAGLLGAALLSAGVCGVYHYSLNTFFVIILFGFAGMLLDSVLGSRFQGKYKTAEGTVVEDKMPGALKINGLNWVSNDSVNLASTILTTAAFLLYEKC